MRRLTIAFLLCALLTIGAYATTTTLQPGQNVQVTAAGQDGSGNAAAITSISCEIDNHALAYCVPNTNGTNPVWVVSRGPAGNFRLTVTGTNSSGGTITSTADFTVAPAPASAVVLTIGSPGGWSLLVPGLPAGW